MNTWYLIATIYLIPDRPHSTAPSPLRPKSAWMNVFNRCRPIYDLHDIMWYGELLIGLNNAAIAPCQFTILPWWYVHAFDFYGLNNCHGSLKFTGMYHEMALSLWNRFNKFFMQYMCALLSISTCAKTYDSFDIFLMILLYIGNKFLAHVFSMFSMHVSSIFYFPKFSEWFNHYEIIQCLIALHVNSKKKIEHF